MNDTVKRVGGLTIYASFASLIVIFTRSWIHSIAGEAHDSEIQGALTVVLGAVLPLMMKISKQLLAKVGVTLAMLVLLSPSACVTVDDQRAVLVGLSASIASTSQVVADQCGRDFPQPCAKDSYVSTELRDSMGRQLRRALDVVKLARVAVNVGDTDSIAEAIAEATQILGVVQKALMREQLRLQGGAP